MNRIKVCCAVICLAVFLTTPALAQQQDYSLELGSEDWRFDLNMFLWALSINGTMGMGGETEDVALGFSDLVDKVDFGLFMFFQARKERWNILSDLMYANLGAEGFISNPDPSMDDLAATMDMKIAMFDLAGAYGISSFTNPSSYQIVFGGKYVSIKPNLDVAGMTSFDDSYTWFEPYLGLRFLVNENHWYANLRIDYGGFGVGSKSYWHFNTGIGYQFARHWSTNLAYRIMSFDYEDTDKGFVFDTQLPGFMVGLGYHF